MKTIKTIAKAALIIYIVLSLLATIAVNLGVSEYEIVNNKGILAVIRVREPISYPHRDAGWTIYQYSPFCNGSDIFLWLIEFEVDGGVRLYSDGLDCFGQYWN